MPNGAPTLFALVLAIWVAGFVVTTHGQEPYPALLQPTFGGVADDGVTVHTTQVLYWVVLDDGRRVRVDEKSLLADSGGQSHYIGVRLPDAASDPDGAYWLRHRLEGLGIRGVELLEVELVAVDFDPASRTWRREGLLQRVSTPMADAR